MNKTAKKNSEKNGVIAALRRAAVRARDVAARTRTPVVIFRDGCVREEHAEPPNRGDLSGKADGKHQHVAETAGEYGRDATS